jgi:type II secretion system protein N
MMKTKAKLFFYGIFTITAFCVFLYLLFPSQMVSALIVSRIAGINPQVQVSLNDTRPSVLPPGLRFKPLSVAYADIPVMHMPYFKVMPAIFSFIGDQKEFTFSGPLGAGALKGHAAVSLQGPKPQTKVTMNLTEVPVDVIEILQQWPNYKLAGEMTAYIDYDSRKGAGGTANVKMDVTPTRIVFNPPVVGLEQMEFSQLTAEMTVTPRMLQIKRCELSGSQLEGKVTGAIVFREPAQNSRITLSCTLKPQPAFLAEHKNDMLATFLGSETAQKRGVIIRISGTLGNPSYVIR